MGLVSYTPEKVEGFDLQVYYVKSADGQAHPASAGMQNDVTCFCDAKAIRDDPSIVAISKNGPALRKNRRFNLPFDFICPTNPEYQRRILDYINDLGREKIQGLTLNLYHFPEEEFCVCPRCVELWRQSGLNWTQWRAQVVTKFVADAKKVAKGEFAVEMFPDPVLAKERFGIDFEKIADLVDYFHVPLSSRDYLTNYWVDLLARDFVKILKKPVVLELSAEMLTEEKTEALLKTVAYVSRHDLKAVLLLVHDSENAREICRYAVKNVEFRDWLRKHEFIEMNKIVNDWAKLY
jgi:hypothetical protein